MADSRRYAIKNHITRASNHLSWAHDHISQSLATVAEFVTDATALNKPISEEHLNLGNTLDAVADVIADMKKSLDEFNETL